MTAGGGRSLRPAGLPPEAGFHGEAAAAANPAVDADDREEDGQRDAHTERATQERAAGQHAGHAVHHAGDVPRLEEHLHERRIVEVPDEALEGLHALLDRPRVNAEAPGLEAILSERRE